MPLIKDLNGNHVIQKCLHRLSAEHRQFIYDAVSEKCVEVATHKHGCCVLQRCIDYASASQKVKKKTTRPMINRTELVIYFFRLSWCKKLPVMLCLWYRILMETMSCNMYWNLVMPNFQTDLFGDLLVTLVISRHKNSAPM